jgi:ABC-2 type transport system ATP-binding protein
LVEWRRILHCTANSRHADADRKQRVPELLKRVGLEEHANKLRLFQGMLQRVMAWRCSITWRRVLDEPTSGLDPVGRILVRDIIRENAQGRRSFVRC